MEQHLLVTRSMLDPTADQGICHDLVAAVAEFEGVSPFDLPPLTSAVDPDALERLVGSAAPSDAGRREVAFPYAGCDVSVASDGEIMVAPPTAAPPDGRATGLDE